MIKFKIGSLVPDRISGTSALMPPIEDRLSTVKAYLKALRAMNRRLITEVRDGILPAYRADRMTRDVDQARVRQATIDAMVLVGGRPPRLSTRDVDQHTFQNIKSLAAALSRITGQTVERILQLESVAHTETFIRDASRALGLDLTAIVRQEDLDEYLRRAVARNTSLITSLSDDLVKRVEQTVIANEVNGRSVKELKRSLVEQFGIVDRRAQLIARDQTAKLNSDMNKIRQQQAGIDEYEWMTSGDERVRELHKGLNGKQYDWNERTGAEGGLPPGQPIQCRCVARAIVVFGDPKTKKTRAPDPTPVETPTLRNARLDREAKSYVVDNGKIRTTEYMTAFDTVTGAIVDQVTSGKKSHVGFTPKFTAAIDDPTRSIMVHHNHPSSSSFSLQDILELTRRPGISGLWAHGHNGSSYFATPSAKARSSVDATWKTINTIDNRVRQEIQTLVYPRQEMTAEDGEFVYSHLVMRLIEQMGLVDKYEFDLQADTKTAIDRHSTVMENLFEALKVKRR